MRRAATHLAAALGDGNAEVWSAALVPIRSNGTWRGEPRFAPTSTAPVGTTAGIVSSLTYAQVRPTRLFHFYVRGFPSRGAPGNRRAHSSMLAGLGFGPVPIRHACTVSFWPTTDAVDGFAYGRGRPHDAVQRRSRSEGWLSESLFAALRGERPRRRLGRVGPARPVGRAGAERAPRCTTEVSLSLVRATLQCTLAVQQCAARFSAVPAPAVTS